MSPRPSTVVRRLLIGAVVALVAGLFLVGWVLWVPYSASVRAVEGGPPTAETDCEARLDGDPADPAFLDLVDRFEEACNDEREARRTTAIVLAVALATAVAAATTMPSRRLVRLGAGADVSDAEGGPRST